jgi:hypothetical protein
VKGEIMETEFLKTVQVNDGYSGDTKTIYLCLDLRSGVTLAVHQSGWYRFNSLTSSVPKN